ncbi:conserved hypothetical protein [Magnetococcus marinus MC-1]|uniref:DUF4276 family protein n=1 Tax=Magnetococcus marinus (strain ATCC BAA-1437 / JCM 17883 / MC-1) TaxID=156889 RepID=A0LCL8_MAGMM|nr:DUF4276 family protein [Magnetococcus marinus]ABK45711.1 conserved hypothetical protein [Magnetococcus marinus MC-1]
MKEGLPIQLVFMLEECSMENTLREIVPKMVDLPMDPLFLTFDGWTDLEKNIPVKLRGWNQPHVHTQFVIIRDNDHRPDHLLRDRLTQACAQAGRPDTLIKLACQELESWFLGDLHAVEKAYHQKNIAKRQTHQKFRNPDKLANPKEELRKLIPTYQLLDGSRRIAKEMRLEQNRSPSFAEFKEGLRLVALNIMA